MMQETKQTEEIKIYEALIKYYECKEQQTEDYRLAFDIFSKYCKNYYNSSNLSEMDEELFNKFFLYYLPKLKLTFSEKRLKSIFGHIYKILERVQLQHNIDLTALYSSSYSNFADDTARIIDLRKELLKNTNSPILSWDPLIIDFNYYKQNDKKRSWLPRKEIYEQGYFEMVDKLGNNYFLLKKIQSQSCYIKLKLNKATNSLLRNNDILHMRLKRRIFSTVWEIIEVKGCYLSGIDQYINKVHN
ncbi:MAG: hypothetical protein ACLFMO_06250 [Eubacteriales bacterium]